MTTHRISLALTGAAAAALLLAGCGSSSNDTASGTTSSAAPTTQSSAAAATTSGGAASSPASADATITIRDFAFGDPITVAPGTTVTVINMDSAEHNANAVDGSFSEPLLAQGESATFVAPTTPGTYMLKCTNHAQMSGMLIVSG